MISRRKTCSRSPELVQVAILAVALVTPFAMPDVAAADTAPKRQIETNQHYLDDVRRAKDVAVDDLKSVFGFVFSRLDDDVFVYPTENYYYFKFYQGGIRYAGNLRLDALDRDDGKLHFAYFRDYTAWSGSDRVHHKILGAEDGVTVTRQDALVYQVTYRDRSVTFRLNNVGDKRPPDGHIRHNESLIGPVFDESGIEFFVYYNKTYKVFQYILNESGPTNDRLEKTDVSDRIVIGGRTGFAYYIDKYTGRKILIGVHNANASVNNYFDGPFDQLPDNFMGDGRLRDAILDIEPELAGQIDAYGNSEDGSERYFVGSYLHYDYAEDLQVFEDCANTKDIGQDEYYACFSVDETYDESISDPASESEEGKPAGAAPAKADTE